MSQDVTRRLASSDPGDREGLVASWADEAAGWSAGQRSEVGEGLVALLGAPVATVAKSFAALCLADVARAGAWEEAWSAPVLRWWTREQDLRGHDPVEGWVHAVAHGADLAGELALTRSAPPERLLGACARRLVAPTEFVWADGEDDRVALAIVRCLSLVEAEGADVVWLSPVAGFLASPQPSPAPPEFANALRTLRSVLALLEVGRPVAGASRVPPQADRVRSAILAILAAATPWLWGPG